MKTLKPQVHQYFIPIYGREIEFQGIKFKDNGFGHHYTNERIFEPKKEILNKISKEILNNLQ